ncbi:MAG: DNA polymerase III subunit beta [Phycisphaerae bacterium]
MKVIAQTAALQEALALAGSIIASRTPKPVLQCVKLIATDGVLTLLATDLEVGARYQISAVQIDEEGEALVPVDRFQGIVRESGSDSLTIETDKQTVHIRGAGSHFKVFGYDPGEYPDVAEFTEDGDFKIPAGTLGMMISKTLFATAKAHSHYAISGVLWEATGKKLQLVATDGHRLAQAKGSLGQAAASEVTAIVPGKLMSLIQRVAGDGEEPLDVKIQENQILVRTPRAQLVSSLVQGNFPKYGDVIPKDCGRKATIRTTEFEHRVRQAQLLTTEESRGVRFQFAGDQLTLSSRSPEAGEAEVTCPVTLDGDEITIAFNPGFLLDALKVIDTDEVSFEMNESNKPAVIKAGPEFLYVLMPMEAS